MKNLSVDGNYSPKYEEIIELKIKEGKKKSLISKQLFSFLEKQKLEEISITTPNMSKKNFFVDIEIFIQ